MLDRITASIAELSTLPAFPDFFIQYVLKTQDEQIEAEISYLLTHNVMDTLTIERLINSSLREMSDEWISRIKTRKS